MFSYERHANVAKMKISKMTKQCIQQAVNHKENVSITYISHYSFLLRMRKKLAKQIHS